MIFQNPVHTYREAIVLLLLVRNDKDRSSRLFTGSAYGKVFTYIYGSKRLRDERER
jgi:hypothetical protein